MMLAWLATGPFDVSPASSASQAKLHSNGELREVVVHLMRQYWSPEQIARTLKRMSPNDSHRQVSDEAIYNALHVIPCGRLTNWSVSICDRPRLKTAWSLGRRSHQGAYYRSAVGTLVERTRLVILVKLEGTTATAAAVGFSGKLNEVSRSLRLSMTYDRGSEMVKHVEITQKTGTVIYFADPGRLWQRGSNENINGRIRQYLPKGTDLSVYSQQDLDELAGSLNARPRRTLDWRSPLEVYTEVFKKSVVDPSTLQ